MDEPLDLSILIVNWQGGALLQRCLESIYQHIASGITFEVLLVDNASTDDSPALVRRCFPQVKMVVNSTNIGFAAANNQAAAEARGRYLLLLNPDTELRPGVVTALLARAAAQPEVAVIAPRLLNSDGSRQRSCWPRDPGLLMALVDAFYLWKVPWLPGVQRVEYMASSLTVARPVAHVLGACMLVKITVWHMLGGLDEGYFLFLEESDFCTRVRRAGWQIWYDPQPAIRHHGQHSMRQQPARNLPHLYRSWCRFYRAHTRYPVWGIFGLKAIIRSGVWLRLVLWQVRYWGARSVAEQEEAAAMRAGYGQVLAELGEL